MEGRWTIDACETCAPDLTCDADHTTPRAMPVVPCDDAAIERAVKVLRTAPAANDRERVMAVVRALAGEVG